MRKNNPLELGKELKDREVKIKSTWYDWLIIYIPELIRKTIGGFKDKIVSLFKTNTKFKNLPKSRTWKVQLTIAINFISSKDVDEDRVSSVIQTRLGQPQITRHVNYYKKTFFQHI